MDEQAVRELVLAACAEAFGIPRDEIHEATEINELFLGEAQAMIENGLAQSGVDLFANSETWLRWRTVGDAIASTHTPVGVVPSLRPVEANQSGVSKLHGLPK